METHSSILDWKIPWTEEPGRLQSMRSQRVGHDWVTNSSLHFNLIGNNRKSLHFFFNCRTWNNSKNLTSTKKKNLTCRKIRNLNIACKFRELSKMNTNSLYRRQQHKSFYLANIFLLVIVLPLILFISFIHDIHFKVSEVGKKSCSEHWKGKRSEGSD